MERTVYHDANTRYTVLRLNVPGATELVTAVGRSDGIEDGAPAEFFGEWTVHPSHGRQFSFSRVVRETPTTPAGIRARLTSYPGVGERMAQRIVERFGEDTLSILDKQPRRLLEVDGIAGKTLERIVSYHKTRIGPLAELEDRLLELDLSPRLASVLARRYGEQAREMLEHQPYRLAREVHGIGFITADRIARALGIEMDSPERIEAGILHALSQSQSDGHCGLPVERLMDAAVSVLGLPPDMITPSAELLIEGGELVFEEMLSGLNVVFSRVFVSMEQHVAGVVAQLALADRSTWSATALPDHLSDGQKQAVAAIAESGLCILTGGPGTGKSTVIRQVIELAEANEVEVFLAAPTGRAAKRLDETTGHPAKTIHRLLEIQGDSGTFFYNANNPLPAGLVVIDEASMLDIELGESLLTALTPAHRLLLVGDVDQLPSVGPGNVLRDLIQAAGDAGCVPVVRLTKIFRQAEGSGIVRAAHKVLNGDKLDREENPQKDFFVVHTRQAARAHDKIVAMATTRVAEAYGFDPMVDVQILCPMHKGQAGTEAFNRTLQQHYVGDNPFVELSFFGRSGRRFHLGDRVMQTRNDYDKGVFNGDIGRVSGLDPEEQTVTAHFDGRSVVFSGREIASLSLAYAISIHKSQGSEFRAIMIPILAEHHVMLRRNLLYTALTRARELCVLVGDPRAIDRAIMKSDAAQRFTGLRERTVEALRTSLGESELVLHNP